MLRSMGTFFLVILASLSIILAVLGMILVPTHPMTWIFIAIIIAIPFIYNIIFSTRYLTWKENYNVGNKTIDDEHKKLLGIINHLTVAAYHDTGSELEEKTLAELVTYTTYHLEHEEKLMQENNYPDLEACKQKHAEIIEQANQLMDNYKTSKLDLTEVLKPIRTVLIEHINDTDKQFFNSIKE